MKTRGLIGIITGSAFAIMTQVGNMPARGESCEGSIQGLKNLIASKGGLASEIKYEDHGDRSPFSNASAILYVGLEHKYWDRMGGSATPEQDRVNQNLANSPILLLPYATRIIKSCKKVVTVSIIYHEWGPSYSIHRDQVVRVDECAIPEMGIVPPWGYTHCL